MNVVPTAVSEADFAVYVHQCAALGGWTLTYHTHDSRHSAAGFPDVVFAHPTRRLLVVAELKGYDARGRLGKPTAEQLAWLEAFRAAGVPAFLWTPHDAGLVEQVLVRRDRQALDDWPDLPALDPPRHRR